MRVIQASGSKLLQVSDEELVLIANLVQDQLEGYHEDIVMDILDMAAEQVDMVTKMHDLLQAVRQDIERKAE